MDEPKPADKEEVKKGFFNKRVLLWLGVILIQCGLAYFIISRMIPHPEVKTSEKPQININKEKKEKKDRGEVGKFYVIEDVIVNPAGTLGQRFVNITLGLECEETALLKELGQRDVQIRDAIIGILVTKRIDQLDDLEDKEQLKKEILEKLNSIVTKGKIKNVYFSNFILQ